MLVPDALYACPYKIHSSQFVKFVIVPEVFSVPLRSTFRFLLAKVGRTLPDLT